MPSPFPPILQTNSPGPTRFAEHSLKLYLAEARAGDEKQERRASRRRERNRERRDRDEYEDGDSEDEFKPRKPMMLEAPGAPASGGAASEADFIRGDRERRERDRESAYAPSSAGGRDRGDRGEREREY